MTELLTGINPLHFLKHGKETETKQRRKHGIVQKVHELQKNS